MEKESQFLLHKQLHYTQLYNPAVWLCASAVHKRPVWTEPNWVALDICFPEYPLKVDVYIYID